MKKSQTNREGSSVVKQATLQYESLSRSPSFAGCVSRVFHLPSELQAIICNMGPRTASARGYCGDSELKHVKATADL